VEAVLAIVVGVLYACGFYLMLRRTLAQLIIGIGLLTNATNVLVFSVAGLTRGNAPLVPAGEAVPEVVVADPVPQALVLTAIVIGFGVLAFFIVLAYVTFHVTGTENLDELRSTDALDYGDVPLPADDESPQGVPQRVEVLMQQPPEGDGDSERTPPERGRRP
jgi:multicomponent Na+:H+ antiporter subunit C